MYLKLGTQLPFLKLGTQSGTAPAYTPPPVLHITASLNSVSYSVYVANASAVLTRIASAQ
jgi:hypothetical protein